jgi:hypothetical protein
MQNGIQGSYNSKSTLVKELEGFRKDWVRGYLVDYIYKKEESTKIDKFLEK